MVLIECLNLVKSQIQVMGSLSRIELEPDLADKVAQDLQVALLALEKIGIEITGAFDLEASA